ncbi:MAG: hypothetical protein ABUL60_08105 [Myxococcales bacterium]
MAASGEAAEGTKSSESAGEGDDEASFKPKRKGALVVALLVVLLGLAAAAFVLTREGREPLRVLVAVDAEGQWWEGSTTAARLLDNVVPHLKKLGFDVVDGGDPAVLKKLEGASTPEEAAKRLGASFIVTGPLKVEVSELKEASVVEVRASGSIHLSHVDGGTKVLGEVRTWSGAGEKPEALRLTSQSLGWQTFDVLLPGLMAHDAIRAILNGSDRIAAGRLSAAKVYLEKRASQLEFAKRTYAELGQKFRAADQSPTKVTVHTSLTQQDGLCALGASGFFVKSSAIRPFYSPVTQALGYFLELERLYWQEGAHPPRTVFEGYNVLGYASASPDGTTAAYVEDLYGAATALQVVRGLEPSKRVFMEPKLRLSEPKVAPGGGLVASWARTCRKCPASVLVVDLATGKEVYRSDAKVEPLGGFAWLGARRLGALVRSTEEPAKPVAAANVDDDDDAPAGPSQRLQAIDFDVAPPKVTLLGSVSGEAQLSLPSSSADGSRVVFSRNANDGMHLALYDAKTARLEPLAVADGYDPALSPAGDKIAFMTDNEIAIYDIAKQTKTPLTHTGSDFSLRYPQFSLDGRVVYFELRAKDPVFPQERSLSAVASVPVP